MEQNTPEQDDLQPGEKRIPVHMLPYFHQMLKDNDEDRHGLEGVDSEDEYYGGKKPHHLFLP